MKSLWATDDCVGHLYVMSLGEDGAEEAGISIPRSGVLEWIALLSAWAAGDIGEGDVDRTLPGWPVEPKEQTDD